jgi:hypothetical protein
VKLIRQEPALVVALASAGLALAITFGLPVTVDQAGAIMAVLQIVAGFIVRANVTPLPPPPGQEPPTPAAS